MVDASFGLELATDGTGLSGLSFSIGDSIFLIDLSNPGNKRFVTVAGFLEQSSYLFSPGVWLSDEIVTEQFDGRLTRIYVSLTDSATASDDFDDSEINTFSRQLANRLTSESLLHSWQNSLTHRLVVTGLAFP